MTDIISSSVVGKVSAQAASSARPQQQSTNEQSGAPTDSKLEVAIPEAPIIKVPSSQEVFAAADRINELLSENTTSRSLRLSMDESLNRAIFTVFDAETNEVIRVIPSDEVIAMARIIEDWIPDESEVMPQGILFNDLT
jgi:flagellar protein FlaG